MRVVIAAAVLTCSTWQGIRTCSGPGGYRSTEASRLSATRGPWELVSEAVIRLAKTGSALDPPFFEGNQ